MSRFVDEAMARRSQPGHGINCAQGVVLPFAREKGFTEDQIMALTAHFGGGMRMGSVCGAVAGGLMVLGLYGADAPADAGEFVRRMKEHTGGPVDCRELLARNARSGGDRKSHCDAMVCRSISVAEDMLRERGLVE